MPKATFINAQTKEIVERELTDQELAVIAISAAQLAENNKQQIENERRAAFANESDPLFFGWQRGENTEQQWLDKVAEIRARHPYA